MTEKELKELSDAMNAAGQAFRDGLPPIQEALVAAGKQVAEFVDAALDLLSNVRK